MVEKKAKNFSKKVWSKRKRVLILHSQISGVAQRWGTERGREKIIEKK